MGGGFAGLAAARELDGCAAEVLLLDRQNHHLFQPLLYQVAMAGLNPSQIASPLRHVLGASSVRIIMDSVVRVDRQNHEVTCVSGATFSYDYLLLAPGVTSFFYDHPEWQSHCVGLKSLDEALSVRSRILGALEEAERCDDAQLRKQMLHFVIIGAGPTGVEMAGAAAELLKNCLESGFKRISFSDVTVHLLERGTSVLSQFPDELRSYALEQLKSLGVKVHLNVVIRGLRSQEILFLGSEGDFQLRTPLVVWAAGVRGEAILDSLDTLQDRLGRVRVTPSLNLPEDNRVFVCGDAALIEQDANQGSTSVPALAPAATQQGRFVGRLIRRAIDRGMPIEAPTFRYVDKGSLATIGRHRAVGVIRGFHIRGTFAWLVWSLVHLFFLVDFRNRVTVFFDWIWSYMRFGAGPRIIVTQLPKSPVVKGSAGEASRDVR